MRATRACLDIGWPPLQHVPIRANLPYLAHLKGLEHRTYAKGLTSKLHDGKISTEHFRPDAGSKYMYLRIINGLFFYSGRMVYGIGLNTY